jgi:hypothetical protein
MAYPILVFLLEQTSGILCKSQKNLEHFKQAFSFTFILSGGDKNGAFNFFLVKLNEMS